MSLFHERWLMSTLSISLCQRHMCMELEFLRHLVLIPSRYEIHIQIITLTTSGAPQFTGISVCIRICLCKTRLLQILAQETSMATVKH
jgi:hypothetical protein